MYLIGINSNELIGQTMEATIKYPILKTLVSDVELLSSFNFLNISWWHPTVKSRVALKCVQKCKAKETFY